MFHKIVHNVDINLYMIKNTKYDPRRRNIGISLIPDFKMHVTTNKYITYWDILARIGGLKSIFDLINEYLYPIVMLSFVFHISHFIKSQYKKNYKKELVKTVKNNFEQLQKNSWLIKDGRIYRNIEKKYENYYGEEEHQQDEKEQIQILNDLLK